MDMWRSPGSEAGFIGLRAGWRLGIFLLLLLGPIVVLVWGAASARVVAPVTPLTVTVNEGVLLIWVALATYIMARAEGRAFGHYGLPGQAAFGRHFWQGAAWGAAGITALLLLIAASGDFGFGHLASSGGELARYGIEWGLAFLAVGFFEEFSFRGYALVTLRGGVGFWPAAVALSAAFGAVHLGNSGESYMGGLSAGLLGLFLCFTWQRTGSLWFAVGMHSAWDYCESFVYGVPDSGMTSPGRLLSPHLRGSHWITGGAVGPEGSVWALALIAALFVLFAHWYPAEPVNRPISRNRQSSAA